MAVSPKVQKNGRIGHPAGTGDAAGPDDSGKKAVGVSITPPKFVVAKFRLVGTAPYMQLRFSKKAFEQMKAKMLEGSTAKKGKKREARDFEADFQASQHLSTDGWHGIPCGAFRAACIDVCRMAGFQMTRAKMSIFVVEDGNDATDQTPLVKILAGPPEKSEMPVPNANGAMDIRVRSIWRQWACVLTVRYDSDQFTLADVTNLIARAGVQVGVGEGRPFSKNSNGLGFGTFEIDPDYRG